jgi:hypothetical protein
MTQTTIVLGCSRTKRTHLAAVVETLAGRGHAVEVVSGLDDNDEPWRDAIHRLGAHGVYVLCSDENVNLRRVSRLRGLLTDASIPPSRAWCGPVDWSKPVEVVRHVEHLLRPPSVNVPPSLARSLGPSEVSGTVVASPLSTPMPDPEPSASQTFVSTRISMHRNWKPLAAIGGVALLAVAAAVPLLSSDDDAVAESEGEVAVSAVAADDGTPPTVEPPSAPQEAAEAKAPESEGIVEVPENDANPEPSGAASNEQDAIISALADQKIRALDVLLMAPEAKELTKKGHKITARLDFEAAFTYCSELDIDGLKDWRLPTAGELASLSANKMLAKGVYWSETEGDSFGNERVVWSVRKKRMKPMRRSYTGARTMCVRNITDE